MKISLSEAFTYLVGQKHFFATVANALQRVASPRFGTMGVGILNGRVVLFYDPSFVEQLSLPAFVWFLEHEMVHVVMNHIPRYYALLSELGDPRERERAERVYNIAADCAANELLRKSPLFAAAQGAMRAHILERLRDTNRDAILQEGDGLILPELYGLPGGRSFEFYQLELMRRATSAPAPFSSAQNNRHGLENHGRWMEPVGQEASSSVTPGELQSLAEQLQAQVKQLVRKVVRDLGKDRGMIPGQMAEWLDAYLAEPITPWWQILTTRIHGSRGCKVQRGIERPNRSLLAMAEEDREIIETIGITHDVSFRIFFLQDTSGSVDLPSLQIGLSELQHLIETDDDVEVRYLQGDAAVTFDEVFNSGDTLPREVLGRGGTDFDAYFTHMAKYLETDETTPDLVVVFTDGYAPVIREELRLPAEIPVIWLLTPEHAGRHLQADGYGEVIVCDRNQTKMWQYRQ